MEQQLTNMKVANKILLSHSLLFNQNLVCDKAQKARVVKRHPYTLNFSSTSA